MATLFEWTEDGIEISVEYDAQDRARRLFIVMPEDLRVSIYRYDGTLKWSVIIPAGVHEFPIAPGLLRRNSDIVSIEMGPPI